MFPLGDSPCQAVKLLQLDSTPTRLHNLVHSSLRSAASAHRLFVFFLFSFFFLFWWIEDLGPSSGNDDRIKDFASWSLGRWSHTDTDLNGGAGLDWRGGGGAEGWGETPLSGREHAVPVLMSQSLV